MGEDFVDNADRFTLYNEAKKHGINVDTVHLDYKTNSFLWETGPKGDEVCNTFIERINECVERGIKIGVFHVVCSDIPAPISEIGFKRVKRIYEHSIKVGFTLVFENIHAHDHFLHVVDRIPESKILFDIGHAHCLTHDGFDIFKKYKDRIIIMHLHNNHGEVDEHNPLDKGTIDFDGFFSKNSMAGNVIQYHLLEINPRGCKTADEFETLVHHNVNLLKKFFTTP